MPPRPLTGGRTMLTLDVWVMVDENGDYVVSREQDELNKSFANEHGDTELATRHIKLTVSVPAPRPVKLATDVPAEPAGGSVRVG